MAAAAVRVVESQRAQGGGAAAQRASECSPGRDGPAGSHGFTCWDQRSVVGRRGGLFSVPSFVERK